MKHLKSYKIFESKNISLNKKLKAFNIVEYSFNEDGTIDCNEDISMVGLNLDEIPFKFNRINGYFNIRVNNLKSLKNCPKYIDRFFNCSNNKLESLEFGPEYVGKDYTCHSNKLTTLKGCIDEAYGRFSCHSNKLTSLEFCPMQVEGDFDCSHNLLIELDRSPFVRGDFDCEGMFKNKPEFNGYCEQLIWQ